MPTEREPTPPLSLAEYVAMLKRRWWLLLLAPLVCAALAFALTGLRNRTYTAAALLLVSQAAPAGSEYTGDILTATTLSKTYSRLVTVRPVLEQVIADLQLPLTVTELAAQITTRTDPDTQLIEVRVADRDPEAAARIASGVSEAFVTWLSGLQATQSGESARALKESIARVQRDMDATLEEVAELRKRPGARSAAETSRLESLENLQRQYQATYAGLLELEQRLDLAQVAMRNRVSVVSRADPPSAPDGRSPLLYAALAGLIGLGAAGVAIFLFERVLDARLRSSDDVRREVALPVIAMLPGASRAALQAPASDAMRLLRTRLQFAANGRGVGAVLVTSADRAEHAAAIAADLALACARAGQSVALVDGNLRSPRQQDIFALRQPAVGLARLLADPSARLDDSLLRGPDPRLGLLLVGAPPDDGGDLLTRERFGQIVERLKARAEVIVIDAPPVLAGPDAALLAAAADHAIVVATAGRTKPERLRMALAGLRASGVSVLGVVLSGVKEERWVS